MSTNQCTYSLQKVVGAQRQYLPTDVPTHYRKWLGSQRQCLPTVDVPIHLRKDKTYQPIYLLITEGGWVRVRVGTPRIGPHGGWGALLLGTQWVLSARERIDKPGQT